MEPVKRYWQDEQGWLHEASDGHLCFYTDYAQLQREKEAMELRWTSARPTVEGWYWWRTKAITTGQITIHGVVQIESDGYCRQEGDYVSHLGGHWAGPIATPGGK